MVTWLYPGKNNKFIVLAPKMRTRTREVLMYTILSQAQGTYSILSALEFPDSYGKKYIVECIHFTYSLFQFVMYKILR